MNNTVLFIMLNAAMLIMAVNATGNEMVVNETNDTMQTNATSDTMKTSDTTENTMLNHMTKIVMSCIQIVISVIYVTWSVIDCSVLPCIFGTCALSKGLHSLFVNVMIVIKPFLQVLDVKIIQLVICQIVTFGWLLSNISLLLSEFSILTLIFDFRGQVQRTFQRNILTFIGVMAIWSAWKFMDMNWDVMDILCVLALIYSLDTTLKKHEGAALLMCTSIVLWCVMTFLPAINSGYFMNLTGLWGTVMLWMQSGPIVWAEIFEGLYAVWKSFSPVISIAEREIPSTYIAVFYFTVSCNFVVMEYLESPEIEVFAQSFRYWFLCLCLIVATFARFHNNGIKLALSSVFLILMLTTPNSQPSVQSQWGDGHKWVVNFVASKVVNHYQYRVDCQPILYIQQPRETYNPHSDGYTDLDGATNAGQKCLYTQELAITQLFWVFTFMHQMWLRQLSIQRQLRIQRELSDRYTLSPSHW